MSALKLKEMLATLSLEEQADIILALRDWGTAEFAFDIERGAEPMPPGGMESVHNFDPGLKDRLQRAVDTKDYRSLKIGVVELFRSLPIVQKEASGARFNTFLSRRLPERVFRLLYETAGLNVDTLRYDPSFPAS